MNHKEAKEQLFREDPELREEYYKPDIAWAIARMFIKARIFREITQQHLAELMKTKQPSIARVENGSYLPSLAFMEKAAEALGTQLIPPRFAFLEEHEKSSVSIFYVTQSPETLQPHQGSTAIRMALLSHNNVAATVIV